MAVTNPTPAVARGKQVFMAKETSFNTYNNSVYSAANAVFINAPAIPKQPLRIVADRQQRNTFSRMRRIPNRYGIGMVEGLDIYIKPSGSLGVAPHGDQVLEGWWGKKTVVAVTSVKYEPLAPEELAGGYPSYSTLIKYGHKVNLLLGTIVKSGGIKGVADDSEGVLATFIGTLEFARRYWIGKDELSGTEATGQTTISVKNAKKFAYGFSASPAVGMKVAFRTVAGVVDDNSGAGYTLNAVDTTLNTIGITPALAGAGLAANDVVYPFIPTPTDVGEPVSFSFGDKLHGEAGDVEWTIVSADFQMNNNQIKIFDFEASGVPYPTRKADVGGNDNLREITCAIEFVENEDDTDFDYLSEQQTAHILKLYWGETPAERFYIQLDKVNMDPPDSSGDAEIHSTVLHHALGTTGDDEGFMMFD